jgi:hypothetical protein
MLFFILNQREAYSPTEKTSSSPNIEFFLIFFLFLGEILFFVESLVIFGLVAHFKN